MAISNSLAKKVEADVKGSQEVAVEALVKNALSEIKNKFKYTESYISTLYDSGFKAYLKNRTFDRPENLPKEIIAINNIKQRIIKQGLEAKKSTEHSSSFGPYLYWIGGISKDIHNNNTVQNVIKGVIDELMAIPDLFAQIAKVGVREFGKSLLKLVKNPKDLWNGLKQAYGDAFTQGLATPEAQYRTGRSATLIVLTFLPGGATKFGLNVAGLRAVTKGISKVTTKAQVKNIARNTSKSAAKSMESGVKSATKTAEKGLKNNNGSRLMYREMNGGAKNYAQRQVGKDAGKISKESQAATKANRVAEMNTKGFYGKRADKLRNLLRYGDKAPVIKQINNIGRWTFRKLDKGTEAIVKKIHPKFYEKLTQQQNRLSAIKSQAEGWAKKLREHPNEIQEVTKKITEQKAKIDRINNQIANKSKGWGLAIGDGGNLAKATERLKRLENDLAQLKKQEGILKNKLKGANEAYLVHQSILEGMNDAQRAGKLAVWIETQQVVSILNRSQIATLDREIAEAVSKIEDISEDLEEGMREIDDLLKEFEGISDGLETGKTEFENDNISIDLPEGTNLSEVDTSKYKIIITGMASKTGSESVNRRIAQQRAENAKKILIEKYGIEDKGQIITQIDLQSEHSDKLGEDVSKWQGARIKLEPTTATNEPSSSPTIDEEHPDASLEEALKGV